MGRLILLAGLCLAMASLASAYHLLCYVNINAAMGFSASDIDASLCTHVVVAYADISGNNLVTASTGDDTFYESVTDLKDTYTDLKVLVAVGGRGFDGDKFSDVASTDVNRAAFAASAITFLRAHELDGLLLDWRYPHRTDDKDQFTYLCEDLSNAFNDESSINTLLLAAAMFGGRYTIDSSYNLPELNQHLDMVQVRAHDYYRLADSVTRHPSPLYPGELDSGIYSSKNAEFAMMYVMNQGIDPEKLLLSIAAYGRTFTLSAASDHGYGHQTEGKGDAGSYTRKRGFLSYYEICSGDFEEVWSDKQQVPYSHKDDQWVGHESVRSVEKKTDFVVNYNFGGIAYMFLDMDDFDNICDTGNYPLLSHINDILIEDKPTLTPTNAGTTGTVCPPDTAYYDNFCIGMENAQFSMSGFPSCYFNCWDDVTHIQSCYSGQIFFEDCQCCKVDTSSSNGGGSCGGEDENFCEGKADGVHAFCGDDTKFYNCGSGVTHLQSCPPGLVFDAELKVCVWP